MSGLSFLRLALAASLLSAGLLVSAPLAFGQSVLIDNDIAPGTLGHFSVEMRGGGESNVATVTANRLVSLPALFTEDVLFEYLSFVDPGNNGGGVRLGASTTSGPTLTGDDEVTSSGAFIGENGNTILWTAVSSIDDLGSVMETTFTFTAQTGSLGVLRFLQYLDEDIEGVNDCVLFSTGSFTTQDLELFTVDNLNVYGVSHSGAFSASRGLVNATFNGWAADRFSILRSAIITSGTAVSPTGVINLLNLPPFTHPVVGPAFGPRDITSAIAWSVDPLATTATIVTTLGGVPDALQVVIDLDPNDAASQVGHDHTVTALVSELFGAVQAGVDVSFEVISGPNAGESSDPNTGECTVNDDCTTDPNGELAWTYVGSGGVGVDEIVGSCNVCTPRDSDPVLMFWDADCNQNGIPDACDIDCAGFGLRCSDSFGETCGGSGDADLDGIPDECVETLCFNEIDDDFDGLIDCDDSDCAAVCGDIDRDGILDSADNCPLIPNTGQDNDDPFVDPNGVIGDPDSQGNACDNCPMVFNEDQADSDGNGVGDVCDQGQELTTEAPLTPVMPGDPTAFLVCQVVNTGEQPLRIPRPNCNLCNFNATGPDGPIPPRFRTPKGFVIPDDVFTLPPLNPAAPGENEFDVRCAISDLWAPENLPQDPSGNAVMIDYVATYSTQGIRDPDLDPATGFCANEPCIAIDEFEVRTTSSFEVASEPIVTTHMARSCVVDPPTWVQQWAEIGGPTLSTTLAFDSAVDPMNIVLASVRLQFEEPTQPGTESFTNNSLRVGFVGGSAMAALGGTAPGTLFTATVTGEIQFEVDDVPVTEFFTASCPIQIAAALVVSIDIKPGAFPNSLNLKSNGNVPVAILSSGDFDATQVDPATVTLAGSQVKVRGKGNKFLASVEDVNGDGLPDLMLHIETSSLELTGQDIRAVLEGRTFDGLRIVGSDSIRVVQE